MVALSPTLRALLASSVTGALHSGWTSSGSFNASAWGEVADCSIAGFVPQFPPNQTQLVVPKNLEPRFIGLGFGVQNYTCSSSNTYTNVGAVAELIDVSCYVNASWFSTIQQPAYDAWTSLNISIFEVFDFVHFLDPPQSLAQHYFVTNPTTGSGLSPKWDFTSSGKFQGNSNAYVIGKVNGTVPSPNNTTEDVTWLEVLKIEGEIADEVFRYDSVGGQPPSSCKYGTSPELSVEYVSKYIFYGGSLY